MQKGCYGEELPKVYNDWDGVAELVTLPDSAAHRVVDKIVLATAHAKTAIVCPPTIYGRGRGPDNRRSQQVPTGAKTILERKRGFLPGHGNNVWHQVHVQDLSDLYLLLGEAALSGGGNATWDQEGYYLAENGSFAWGDVFKSMTKLAHKRGLIASEDTPALTTEDLIKLFPYGHLVWGTNSRGESIRGKRLLGWSPHRAPLMEDLPEAVEIEAKDLGLIQGHAAKVAD